MFQRRRRCSFAVLKYKKFSFGFYSSCQYQPILKNNLVTPPLIPKNDYNAFSAAHDYKKKLL